MVHLHRLQSALQIYKPLSPNAANEISNISRAARWFGLEQLSVPHQQKHTQCVHADAEGLIVTADFLCSGLRVQMF